MFGPKLAAALLSLLWLSPAFAPQRAPQARARTYTIAASESSFNIFVGKAGLLSVLAHNHNIAVKSFTGRVVIPDGGAANGTLELEADARSLQVLDNVSEKDKAEITKSMHEAVLESAKYPKIVFKSASVLGFNQTGNAASFTVNGDLTLHGVTKRIAVPVKVEFTAGQLRAAGKYTLKQTDFGITPYSAVGGAIKVKNEVVISFSLVAK
jgi:polyisoprenoid-binding protein YceI